jgi:hypothetical protein
VIRLPFLRRRPRRGDPAQRILPMTEADWRLNELDRRLRASREIEEVE